MLRPTPILIVAALFASSSLAADPAIHARRTPDRVSIDGRLDETAWADAPGYDQFVETYPQDNVPVPAAFRTEAKVLFDDEFLYVGVRCFDPEPSKVVRQLSRRDTLPTADYIQLALDPTKSGTTGYGFIVNAAGVQRDLLLYGNVNSTDTWDAVWDGAAHATADGWSVEFAIPLRVLRFERKAEEWGIQIRRVVPRTHQTFDSHYVPRNANSANTGAVVVNRFGALQEVVGLEPQRELELTPYAAARVSQRPEPGEPTSTQLFPSMDVGLDLKTSLTSSLNLTAAINPDFGQVEADQIIQNVNTFEQFFPEKRPFFTQGLDLFQPVGSEYGTQQGLFYSRRIGLEAPILAAVKVTGSVRDGTEVGILDAVEMGAGNPSRDSADRRWQFHLRQPLHFGPNNDLPIFRPTARNHAAVVVRQRVAPGATVGAMLSSAVPLEPRCTPEDFPSPAEYVEDDCASFGANAAAVDFNVRSSDGVWGALGQVGVSQAVGGPNAGRRLPDGTVLRRGDLGEGFYFRFGKFGGEPFRFTLNGTFEPPKFNLNESGFQPFTNYQWYAADGSFIRPHGFGPFKSAQVGFNVDVLNFSADRRWTPRGRNASIYANLTLPSFDTLFLNLGFEDPQFDLNEMYRSAELLGRDRNVAVQKTGSAFVAIGIGTDSNRPLFGQFNLAGSHTFENGPLEGAYGWQASGNATWHPAPFLETFLAVEAVQRNTGARFIGYSDPVDGAPPTTGFFGVQRPGFFSATLRQQVVLSPKLTLQAYAQLFSGVIAYTSAFSANIQGRDRVEINQFQPATFPRNPNAHFSALNLNLVLRWEYRLGSTIYVVYTRAQEEPQSPDGVPSTSLFPSRLGEGPVNQTALVKWSYWWDV